MSAPVTTPQQQVTAFPHQAAKASWTSAVIVFFLILFGGRTEAKAVIELIAFLLMVVGFALGVIALFGVRKYGAKQILAPALLGILIHGLLLSIFIPNFLAARAKARERTSALSCPFFSVRAKVPLWSHEFKAGGFARALKLFGR